MDINNLTTIALISQAAVARMQTWYEDGLYQCVSYCCVVREDGS